MKSIAFYNNKGGVAKTTSVINLGYELAHENKVLIIDTDGQANCSRFFTDIAAAEIVLPLVFYAAWMRKGFKFEETGTFTSTTFRGLFGKFKPTKK